MLIRWRRKKIACLHTKNRLLKNSMLNPHTSTRPAPKIKYSVRTAFFLWLFVAAVFCLSSSGRLDMIDAQFKYETTQSLVAYHDAKMRDPWMIALTDHPDTPYSDYPLGSALPSLIPVGIGLYIHPDNTELAQFLWAITRALFAALIAPALFLIWTWMGIPIRTSIVCSILSCLASLIWPTAASSFEQAERGLIVLLCVFFAFVAYRKKNNLAAFFSGLSLGYLLNYQGGMLVIVPALIIGTIDLNENNFFKKITTPFFILIGLAPGLVALLAFNVYRFDVLWPNPAAQVELLKSGNIAIGIATLLMSPGKSIFLFSPLIFLGFLGLPAIYRSERRLFCLIAAVSVSYFLMISHLPFPGGDWCWGPRYMSVILPIIFLGLPFGIARLKIQLAIGIVAISLSIQVVSLWIDHQQFYFRHNLDPNFYIKDPLFHFRHSQLSERFGEIFLGPDFTQFKKFNSSPYDSLTYAPFGPPPQLVPVSNLWVRQFAVFYLPRPWPLWLCYVPEERRFLNLPATVTSLLAALLVGCMGLIAALRRPLQTGNDAA